jgi:RNA polymerase-binding transcription factor DksA
MRLTNAQRKHLERRLRKERERVLGDLNRGLAALSGGDEQEPAGDLTKVPLHFADRGTDSIDTEVAMSNATRESRELAAIAAALESAGHRDRGRRGGGRQAIVTTRISGTFPSAQSPSGTRSRSRPKGSRC